MPTALPQLSLADAPLKQVLGLFAPQAPLRILALGDTWHPGAGYVDAVLVAGVNRVAELLAFPYDFPGLVTFEATVADVTIRYDGGSYQLTGPAKALHQLAAQLQAMNAQPGSRPLQLLPTRR